MPPLGGNFYLRGILINKRLSKKIFPKVIFVYFSFANLRLRSG